MWNNLKSTVVDKLQSMENPLYSPNSDDSGQQQQQTYVQQQQQQHVLQQPGMVQQQQPGMTQQPQMMVIKPVSTQTPDKEHYEKTFNTKIIKLLSYVQIPNCFVTLLSMLVISILDRMREGIFVFAAGVGFGVWAIIGFQVKEERF